MYSFIKGKWRQQGKTRHSPGILGGSFCSSFHFSSWSVPYLGWILERMKRNILEDLVSEWWLGDQLTNSSVTGVAAGELNLEQWKKREHGETGGNFPASQESSCKFPPPGVCQPFLLGMPSSSCRYQPPDTSEHFLCAKHSGLWGIRVVVLVLRASTTVTAVLLEGTARSMKVKWKC